MAMFVETDITAACAELETALIALLGERDNEAHCEAAQERITSLGDMADALVDTEDHADLGGLYWLPEQ